VALTNTASTALTVTISSGQDPRKQEKNINLNPRETNVVNLREFVAEPVRGPSATLLSLTHNGAPGALITTGFALNDQNGFASNLLFVDRATATSNKLAGAHVRIGQAAASDGFPAGTTFSAPLVVANTGDLPSEAHVAVDYTIDAAPHRVELTSFTLAAQEIKQLDLAQELAQRGVSGPVDEAGVDISYSGQTGAVIGRLTSVDGSGDYSFDVPIKDPLAGMNRVSGSYPWRLDQGYTTVLHLKNTIDKEVTAIVQVRYEGGNYNPELIKLAPYQTVAIDIRELRDAQQKDIRGGVMPNDVTSGQVIWYEREMGSLIGRAEIFNVGVGVADSFSCQGNCPCPSSFRSAFMSPTTFSSLIGDSGLIFRPQEMDSDCNNFIFGPFDETNSVTLWSSTDTSIATVDSGGTVICVGAGSCSILATFSATVFGGPPGSCNAITVHPTPSGGMSIRPSITGPHTLWWFGGETPPNYSTSATLTTGVSGTGSYSWEITSGTDQLSFDDNSTSKVTSSNQVTVKTIGFSTSENQIGIKVTVNGMSSDTFSMTSRTPWSLQPVGAPQHTPDGLRGYITQIRYQIFDRFGAALTSDVPANENFTTGLTADYPSMNWFFIPPDGAVVPPTALTDVMSPPAVFSGIIPIPDLPHQPPGSVKVVHRSQEFHIGSTTVGVGRRVQSNLQQYYLDHGAHENVVSPSPNP
jgi:hypothetical protein